MNLLATIGILLAFLTGAAFIWKFGIFLIIGVFIIGTVYIWYFVRKKIIPLNARKTEELKKYKELLDSGIITQEEFNFKKDQLFKKM